MSLSVAMWSAFGALVGSFLNVCVARWPAGQSVVAPRSRCPHCLQGIRWYDNVPVLSWILLRARCRSCSATISARYPLVEIAVGALWGIAAAYAGSQVIAIVHAAGLGTVLLGIMLTDAEHFLIPDAFSLLGLAFAFLGVFAAMWWHAPLIRGVPLPAAVVGALAGAGVITMLGWIGSIALGREAMGDGDAPLMAVLGAVVGPWGALLTIFVASLLGILWLPLRAVRTRIAGTPSMGMDGNDSDAATTVDIEPGAVPFGLLLVPAAVIVAFWGEALIGWYLGTTGLR